MASSSLVDQSGKPVRLGKLIGKGGEGEVYQVDTDPHLVAKVYTRPAGASTDRKLRELVRIARPELLRVAALPTGTLHKGATGRPVTGVLMPLVPLAAFRPIHFLYSPAHRRTAFPSADWRFLMHTARNCASAFERLHEAGIIVGDVNHSNLLVAENTDVRLIDCDSFQVRRGGEVYRCEVGVPEFTPPELQGGPFGSIDREPNHDNFGLAVLIFHLLFMGRHPYSGVYKGKGDMPLEKAIREHRFAYGPGAARAEMDQPPLTLRLEAVTTAVGALLTQAFSREGARANGRPTAATWKAALDELIRAGFSQCPSDVGHIYPKRPGSCPWCELIARGAPNYFLTVALSRGRHPTATATRVNIAELWGRIEAYALPRRAYQRPVVPVPAPTPLPQSVPAAPLKPLEPPLGVVHWFSSTIGCACLCVALTAGGAVPFVSATFVALAVLSVLAFATAEIPRRRRRAEMMRIHRAERGRREQALEQGRRAVTEAERRISAQTADFVARLDAKKRELQRCYAEYQSLGGRMGEERSRLEAAARESQFEEFLDRFLIEDASIKDISTGRKAVLRSFGIETAADVTEQRVRRVPRFGHKLTGKLLRWRESCARHFRYDPKKGVPQAKLDALAQKYGSQRRALENQLQAGALDLQRLVEQAHTTLGAMEAGVRHLLEKALKAEQDMRVFL